MPRLRVLPVLLAFLLVLVPAATGASSSSVVVSQLYGGGGNSGATFTRDFIELANRSADAVTLDGWSVQYLPGTPSAASQWQVTPLDGEIQGGSRYLVAEATGPGGTTELPNPDATGTIAMAAGSGTVALVSTTTALTCKTSADCAVDSRIVDLVGYGSAVVRETAPAPAASNTTSVARNETLSDTDNNSVDFTAGNPTPTNSSAVMTTSTAITSS